jgi:hypothetical protein
LIEPSRFSSAIASPASSLPLLLMSLKPPYFAATHS